MKTTQLQRRLYLLAMCALSEANRKNPFITQADAMRDLNQARTACRRANVTTAKA
jgi:hypothetical protein